MQAILSLLFLFFLGFFLQEGESLNFEMVGKTEECFRKNVKSSFVLSANFVVSGAGENKVAITLKDPNSIVAYDGGMAKDSAFVIRPEKEGIYTLCFKNTDKNRKTVSFHLDNGELTIDIPKNEEDDLTKEQKEIKSIWIRFSIYGFLWKYSMGFPFKLHLFCISFALI